MSDEIEGLGGLVNAVLAAKALDTPSAGDASCAAADDAADHGNCPNCDAVLHGNFCGQCGQRAHVHRTITGVGHEFLHYITHFDGKAWHTLPMLAFRPGRLTRDYIEGKRARYIAPVPLFLLVIFLMFFVFSFVHLNQGSVRVNTTPAQAKMSMAELDKEIERIDTQMATVSALPASDPSRKGRINDLKLERAGIVATHEQMEAVADGKPADIDILSRKLGKEVSNNLDNGTLNINIGSENFNEQAKTALKNPQLFIYKVQSKAYKLSFLLVPLSLPWLWLMFAWRRDIGMYDHAIFALYSISFMSLLFVIASAALALGLTDGSIFLYLLIPAVVHMFFQLKGAYSLGTVGAAWRTAALSLASIITLALYLMILLVIGLLG